MIITSKLPLVLDKCTVSDRSAVHILMKTAKAFGHKNTNDLVINRSWIQRSRQLLIEKYAKKIRADFSVSEFKACIVLWARKLLPDLPGNENVDKLPIIVRSDEAEKLLGVQKLFSGPAVNKASVLYRPV